MRQSERELNHLHQANTAFKAIFVLYFFFFLFSLKCILYDFFITLSPLGLFFFLLLQAMYVDCAVQAHPCMLFRLCIICIVSLVVTVSTFSLGCFFVVVFFFCYSLPRSATAHFSNLSLCLYSSKRLLFVRQTTRLNVLTLVLTLV